MIGRTIAAFFLGALWLAAAAPAATSGTPANTIQDLLDRFRYEYGFPGATAAIALPDGGIVTAAAGFADVEKGVLMTSDSRMLAASIGKSFVAATTLALESEGVLSRDDRVASYLGDRPWFDRLPNAESITVGNLLHHTSGLPDHVHLEVFKAEMARHVRTGQTALSPEEMVAFVLDTDALFAPGEAWAYSDTGYLLLGLIIEEVSDRTYYDLVSEYFLNPLGLSDTEPSVKRVLRELAVGYTVPDNDFGMPPRTMDNAGRLAWDPAMEWTGGGFISTSGDLAAWGQALFTGTAMEGRYLDRLLDGVPISPDAPGIQYGTGVAIYTTDTPRGRVYGHGGWIPAYISSLRHYADHGVTVAFQINSDVSAFDDSSDLVSELEAALADLAISMVP